ncbi:hypothetical protein ACHAWF_007194 [Thalassiosira exigua]
MKFSLPVVVAITAFANNVPASVAAKRGRRAVSSADEEAAVAARRLDGNLSMPTGEAKSDNNNETSIFDDAAASAGSNSATKKTSKSSKAKGGGRSTNPDEFFHIAESELERSRWGVAKIDAAASAALEGRLAQAEANFSYLPKPLVLLLQTRTIKHVIISTIPQTFGEPQPVISKVQSDLFKGITRLDYALNDHLDLRLRGYTENQAGAFSLEKLEQQRRMDELETKMVINKPEALSTEQCNYLAGQVLSSKRLLHEAGYGVWLGNDESGEEAPEQTQAFLACNSESPLLADYVVRFFERQESLIKTALYIPDQTTSAAFVNFALQSFDGFAAGIAERCLLTGPGGDEEGSVTKVFAGLEQGAIDCLS